MSVEPSPSTPRTARAYAWFYRTQGVARGRWRFAGPEKSQSILTMIRKKRKGKSIPIGEVIRTSPINSRYDYLCIRVDVPQEVIDEIKEI